MKYVDLNNTELNVSRICLGTAGFGEKLNEEECFRILDAFVQAGGNFIDTANAMIQPLFRIHQTNCSYYVNFYLGTAANRSLENG